MTPTALAPDLEKIIQVPTFSGSQSRPDKEEETWRQIQDLAERRRMQNREAQRTFRMSSCLQSMYSMASSSTTICRNPARAAICRGVWPLLSWTADWFLLCARSSLMILPWLRSTAIWSAVLPDIQCRSWSGDSSSGDDYVFECPISHLSHCGIVCRIHIGLESVTGSCSRPLRNCISLLCFCDIPGYIDSGSGQLCEILAIAKEYSHSRIIIYLSI